MFKKDAYSCTYCGAAFTGRAEPLGRSLCPLCLNVLNEKYARSHFVSQLSREFNVGSDAVKQWAQRKNRPSQSTCISCGRELRTRSVTGQCPLCIVAQRAARLAARQAPIAEPRGDTPTIKWV